MPSCFVRPTSRRLDLSQGHWILVRDRLTAGDQREMFKRYYVKDPDGTRRVDNFESAVAMCLAYLVDWSMVDETGEVITIRDEPVDIVRSALDHLEPDWYTEIKTAIEAHVAEMEVVRAEEKKVRSGATTSSATSPSPAAATGGSSGSASSTPMST